MKKSALLFLLVLFTHVLRAQTGTTTVITGPCHNDGIISTTFTGVTPPLTVKYTTYGTLGTVWLHTGVSGTTDILTGYPGGPVWIDAVGPDSIHAYTFFGGVRPFRYIDSSFSAVCPALGMDTIIVDSGGTAPFTYYWYNKTTGGFVGSGSSIHVPSGQYGCTITDAAGCTFGSAFNPDYISVYTSSPFHDSMMATVANCTNGSASAMPVGGGVSPFSYHWSNGATTPTITGLVTGMYGVNITDSNGCSDSSAIFVPQSISITVPVTPTPATCVANNGAVIAFGSGGMPPYSYIWSNGATTQSQTGLAGGYYGVNVTDANGCVGSGATTVGIATPITVTYTTTPSLCTTPDGTATLTISGGTAPYSILWHSYPAQTTITATGLNYGFYNFDVTDAVGCKQSGTVYVPPIDVMSVAFSSIPALCTLANGTLTAYPSGGVAPYHYLWSTGATTPSITSQPAGGYNVTITDNLGCVVVKTPYLPSNSPLGVGIFTTPASCIFTADGKDSANVWGGTPPYSYAWTSGGTTRTITSLATGPYWLYVTDAAGCTVGPEFSYVGYDTAGTSCYCTIAGTVFADYNNNCIQDAGEPGIPNIQIQISGRGYTYTDASGNYSKKVPTGAFTISETVKTYYPLAGCQANNVLVSVPGGGCTITQNFANAIDTIHDMHISHWNYLHDQPVIGHVFYQDVVITNAGTVQEDSVLASIKPDGQIFAPTFVPGGYFNGSPYWYNTADSFTSMAPGANKSFLLNYAVPTDIPLGTIVTFKDTVAYKAPVSNWLNDYSPWNNVKYLVDTIHGSFDPNFKQVSPQGTGANGTITYNDSVLEYMVHFQNTGTSMAENITVIDTLDDNLDWTTLEPVYESGKCQVNLAQMGTKKVASFVFRNINLPAERNDELRSNGMFTYTIHLKRRLPVGTVIRNNASIYFDYNAPVKTNSTINTIGTPDPYTGVHNVIPVTASFEVYPNPADNSVNAVVTSGLAGNASINITDVTGRNMMTRNIALQKGTQNITLDISRLTPGTYFISCSGNGSTNTRKLVVVH